MVVASMAWLASGIEKVTPTSNKFTIFRHEKSSSSSPMLEILAFETAKTMSRLVALYKSLSDDEFFKLRTGPVKSPGVAYLNSADEAYLLGLACKEKLDDLDRAARVISRLAKKCTDEELNRFEIAYHDMKQGVMDVCRIGFNSRSVCKTIEKMQKYANTTSVLYASLIGLNESEQKMHNWKRDDFNQKSSENGNIDYFNEKISLQSKQVRHFKQISLWSQTFDKSVGLMAPIVSVVYARICTIFKPFVPSLPSIHKIRNRHTRLYLSNQNQKQKQKEKGLKIYPEANYCLLVDKEYYINQSGPLMKIPRVKQGTMKIPRVKQGTMKIPRVKQGTIHFHSGELTPHSKGFGFQFSSVTKNNNGRNQWLIQSTPPNTVGAAGLAFRYANLISMAESYLYSTTIITDEAREHMYEMLPISLKQSLRRKLKSHRIKDGEEQEGQQGLAEGWKEALEEIIGWLAPMAHDTLRWQQEKNLEQQKFDAKPTVLLLQTLHFSDLEKTEAAIVEVLVGLSCIYRYENRRERGGVCCNHAYIGCRRRSRLWH